ncbi:MAG: hypothetical protein GY854_35290 [Deltaproteobacteria bacterium]|nr:hypothetical protein [Deltaproteobacteria bacterium]
MKSISFIAPELKRLEGVPATILVVFRFAEMRPLRGISSLVDWRLCGHLSRLVIDGFLTGAVEESLLMPLGGRLPQEYLLVLGIGERERFNEEAFHLGMKRMFKTIRGLNRVDIVVALPGRPEGACETTDAVDWFLSSFREHGCEQDIRILETTGAQKTMAPAVERWRLRQLVP